MSSPMQPQSPYRLAMPATLTTTSTTATTSTSSSTGISSTTPSVVPSTAPAPLISSVLTSSIVSVSAMSTVITSPSTVTSPVASVPSASSASSTAAASTFYLTTDPGIPGPSSRLDENLSVVVKHQTFLERNNQHVVHDTAQSVSPPKHQQPYRQQRLDNIFNRHVLKEHGTHPTNFLDNFHRKVHNNREQHGIGRIVNRLHRVSNTSAIGV